MMHHRSKSVLRVVGILLGLAVVVVGVKWTGVGAIRAALSRVGVNIAWMFAAYAAGTVVAAFPWRRLFPRQEQPSRGATIASRFAASGLNALVPFFGLGETARLLWLPRGDRSPGLAALIVDRLLFLAAGAPILIVAALAATRVPAVPRSYEMVALVSAAVILAAVAGIGAGAAHGRLAGKMRWALLLFGVAPIVNGTRGNGAAGNNGAAAGNNAAAGNTDRIDSGLRGIITGSRARLAAGFALHLLARLLLAAEIFAGLHILGAHVGPLETMVFIGIPIGLSVIGTFVPGQIGLQEGASALVAAALGIGPATGIALVFLQRLRQLVFVPLAGLLIALVPYGPRTPEP